MNTRTQTSEAFAAMRLKVDELLEQDMPNVLGLVMDNWQDYRARRGACEGSLLDAMWAFRAIEEAMAARKDLINLQGRLSDAHHAVCSTNDLDKLE